MTTTECPSCVSVSGVDTSMTSGLQLSVTVGDGAAATLRVDASALEGAQDGIVVVVLTTTGMVPTAVDGRLSVGRVLVADVAPVGPTVLVVGKVLSPELAPVGAPTLVVGELPVDTLAPVGAKGPVGPLSARAPRGPW